MSGTGKSTVIAELQARGFAAIDLDTDQWCEWVPIAGGNGVDGDRDWVWREDRVGNLLAYHRDGVLFISGTASNQVRFYRHLEYIVLLSSPAEVMARRLANRTTNPYGRRPEELERCLRLKQTVEPQLRKAATVEVDTSTPLDEVVSVIVRLIAPAVE
ncbi:MAG: shikimate kinase [Chloroflexi bacterium]|nr:shikimate kinase [Chloroflexota bacterium]